MYIKIINKLSGVIAGSFLTLFMANSFASSYEKYSVQALAPLDGKVVIRYSENILKIMKIGDLLPDSNIKILQILSDHIVVKKILEKNPVSSGQEETGTVWIYKVTSPGGQSKVVQLSNDKPDLQSVQIPSTLNLNK